MNKINNKTIGSAKYLHLVDSENVPFPLILKHKKENPDVILYFSKDNNLKQRLHINYPSIPAYIYNSYKKEKQQADFFLVRTLTEIAFSYPDTKYSVLLYTKDKALICAVQSACKQYGFPFGVSAKRIHNVK